jgi:hypothetical protein
MTRIDDLLGIGKEYWSRGYHRISDDSVSSGHGFASREEATADALSCFESPDIDEVWVRHWPDGEVVERWVKPLAIGESVTMAEGDGDGTVVNFDGEFIFVYWRGDDIYGSKVSAHTGDQLMRKVMEGAK